MNTIKTLAACLALLATATASTTVQALTMPAGVFSFSTGFESGLGDWFDRNPASPDAALFDDPLRAGNKVLGFNRTMGSGSIFTNTPVSSSGSFTLSFDYLGLAGRGGVAGDRGGYIGVSVGGNGSAQYWIGGTGSHATPLNLIDDGTWHRYSHTFTLAAGRFAAGQALRVMVEDWDGSRGVAGDAFFDNIVLRDSSVDVAPPAIGSSEVPEPGSLALSGLALLAAWGTVAACRRQTIRRQSLQQPA